MLQELLQDRIEFIEAVKNWEDSIYKTSESLLKQGFITKNYQESIIKSINDSGDYIILCDGVAMPHSRPENGALKTGMSFTKLKNGVYFPLTKEPVFLFFTLVATDSNTHIKAMQQLAEILTDENSLSRLLNVLDKEEFLEIIKGGENGENR